MTHKPLQRAWVPFLGLQKPQAMGRGRVTPKGPQKLAWRRLGRGL